jgi:hypothetical protein
VTTGVWTGAAAWAAGNDIRLAPANIRADRKVLAVLLVINSMDEDGLEA